MGDWSIIKRINVLAGALIGALIVVAIAGIGAMLNLKSNLGTYSSFSSDVNMAVAVQEDIIEARAEAIRFRDRPEQSVAELFSSNMAEAGEVLATLRDLRSGAFGEEIERLARLSEAKSAYEQAFGAYIDHEATRSDLIEALTVAASRTERAINEAADIAQRDSQVLAQRGASNALTAYFRAFIAYREFEDSADAAVLETAYRFIEQAKGDINGTLLFAPSEELKAAAATAGDALDDFRSAIVSVAEAIALQREEAGRMDEFGPAMVAIIDEYVAQKNDARSALQDRSSRVASWTIWLLIIGAVALVAATSVIALRFGEAIRSSIKKSLDAMAALADGDLDVRIENTESRSEIGDIARALVVFRDNGIGAREAAKREAAAQQIREREREEEQARQAEADETARLRQEEARQAMIGELSSSIGTVVAAAAEGNFTTRITKRFDEPELQNMADGINRLLDTVHAGVGETAKILGRMAAGEFDTQMDGRFAGQFADLQQNVNDTIESLSDLIVEIVSASQSVSDQSSRMNEASENLARRAEHQAASLEETTAAMREIAGSVARGAEEAGAARKKADQAVEKADHAGREVTHAVDAMQEIRAASGEIEEIVSVIEGIAFQTNLLALNASVEAARAGTAGKGFAVVATEVRDLAQRSADASQNIKALIEKSASKIETGVGLVENTGSSLSEVVETVRHMAEAMTAIANGARDQSAGVAEIQAAIGTLDELTQKNAQMADQTRADAQALAAASDAMRDKIGRFRVGATSGPDAAAA